MTEATPVPLPIQPQSAGRAWRDRFHTALAEHDRLAPNAMLDALATKIEDDPIGVFKAITATLPKELDVSTQPQVHHLHLLRIVALAQDRGIDLGALLEPPEAAAEEPEWLS